MVRLVRTSHACNFQDNYMEMKVSQAYNREEKSLRHVAMVAKFLDDNKPKKWIRTPSNFIGLIHFHFYLANVGEIFLGWIWKDII